MAEKGELICDDSVPASPAITPRPSTSEVDDKKIGDENSDNAMTTMSSAGDNQDVKSSDDQAKTDTKGFH